MRLKSALWVAAYLRRCQIEGCSAVVRRRGAEEAGAIFVRICRLDGTSDLFGPAPQSAIEPEATDRIFAAPLASQPAPDAEIETYLSRELKSRTAPAGISSTLCAKRAVKFVEPNGLRGVALFGQH